jgi:hypothetical protein
VTSQGTYSRARPRAMVAVGALLALAAAAAAASDAEVYKWIDDNGVVHYSDVPDNSQAVETGIRFGRTNTTRVREEQLREWEQMAQEQQQEETAREEQQVAARRQAEDRSIQTDRCEKAREQAKRYSTAHRLYEPLPNGDRRYLSDEETTAARQAAESQVDEWCK